MPPELRNREVGMGYGLRTLLLGVLAVATCACGAAGRTTSQPGAAPAPAASAGSSLTAPAGSPPPEPLAQKVTVAYPSVAGGFLPLWLAADAQLFAKYGLDVELTYIASGTTA